MRRAKKRAGSERKPGYAVVGLGHIAQSAVLPGFQNAENSQLVALVSSNEDKRKKLGKRYGVKTYSYDDYDACLADPDVDAVYIALPNTMHAEYTVRAARAGVHVLCEKPMAVSEEECQRMIRECREHDVRLMIAYRLHFEEANLRAVELVNSGRIGRPRFFTSEFSYQVKAGNIRTDPSLGGGPIWDIGIYCVNATRYLFQAEPLEVFAYGTGQVDPRFRELHDTVTAVMKFPDDRLASFTCSFASATTSNYRVVGSEGDLRVNNAYEYEGEIEHVLTVKERSKRKVFAQRDQFGPELSYFTDCVLEGREPEPSGEEGLMDIRIIEAINASVRHRRPVELEAVEKQARPTLEQEIHMPRVREPRLVEAEAPSQ